MKDLQDQTQARPTLEAGSDNPRIYREFLGWFPGEEFCITYIEKLRWPNGIICPACSSVSESWTGFLRIT